MYVISFHGLYLAVVDGRALVVLLQALLQIARKARIPLIGVGKAAKHVKRSAC
jgi:hypothetical protein